MQATITDALLRDFKLPADVARVRVWDGSLPGFGAVIGRKGAVLIVRGRVGGKRRDVIVGRHGLPGAGDDHGSVWTVKRARAEAMRLIGGMSAGVVPSSKRAAGGPTLREGLALHVSNMRKRSRAPRSIETIETEVPRHLEAWLDRPITELRGADLVALHDSLSKRAKYTANRIVAHVSAIWNATDRVHELNGRNPARAVERNAYSPKRERVADEELPAWYVKVQTLTPVRRDLRLFALFTGMRDEAASRVRWEHFDAKRGALVVPKPKGGEAKAFTLPLAPGVVAMLVARRADNAKAFAPFGGDGGWTFPTMSRDGKRVQPVTESKEYRRDDEGKKRVKFLPGMHVSRRTFLSVATEAGIAEIDRHVLANHAFGRQSVNATYIAQSFDHLRTCAATIETALLKRMGAAKAKRQRAR